MKEFTLVLLLLLFLGCNARRSTSPYDGSDHARAGKADLYHPRNAVEGEQAPTWTDYPEDTIPPGCNQFTRCRAYTVISYDGTWRNDFGNEGLFVLRFKDVWITAFCGDKPGTCWPFIETVGNTIWLDDETTDLLYFHHERVPKKGDAVLVVMKREMKPTKQ